MDAHTFSGGIMATEQQRPTPVTRDEEALIVRKLEIVARLRETQAENAKINLELFRRGLGRADIRCW
jgi:hypothetical protein